MKKRLKHLAVAYAIPIIAAVFYSVFGDLTINGEVLGVLGLTLAGFTYGLILEGLFLMAGLTWRILTCDEKDLK